MISANTKQVLNTARRWLKAQIVKDVPEENALCEYYCRKGQCQLGEWENCERRLKDLEDLRGWKARHKAGE